MNEEVTSKREEYDFPRQCEFCGSDDLYIVVIHRADLWCQARYVCRNCGNGRAIPKAVNLRKRTNTTLTHMVKQVKKKNPSCFICGSEEGLEVHHIIPVDRDKGYQYTETNMITLCKRCHDKVHGRDQWTWIKKGGTAHAEN